MIQCGLTNENLAIREVDQCVLNLERDQTNSQTSYSLAQYIKANFPKTTNSINAHNWGYKWGRHTQR